MNGYFWIVLICLYKEMVEYGYGPISQRNDEQISERENYADGYVIMQTGNGVYRIPIRERVLETEMLRADGSTVPIRARETVYQAIQ